MFVVLLLLLVLRLLWVSFSRDPSLIFPQAGGGRGQTRGQTSLTIDLSPPSSLGLSSPEEPHRQTGRRPQAKGEDNRGWPGASRPAALTRPWWCRVAATESLFWSQEDGPSCGRGSSTYRGNLSTLLSSQQISICLHFIDDIFLIHKVTYIISLRLSLNTMTLQVNTICVNTAYGVAISVNGIAQVWKLPPARHHLHDREYLNNIYLSLGKLSFSTIWYIFSSATELRIPWTLNTSFVSSKENISFTWQSFELSPFLHLMQSLQTFPQHDDPDGDLSGSVHLSGSQHHCHGHSSGPAIVTTLSVLSCESSTWAACLSCL